MIAQLAELHRVHPQLASHLHLGVGGVIVLSRLDPPLYLLVQLSFLRHALRFASIISFKENAVLVILVLTRRFFRHGQRLMDRLDDVLIVGLDETTQNLTSLLWTNAGYCFNRG